MVTPRNGGANLPNVFMAALRNEFKLSSEGQEDQATFLRAGTGW